MLTVSHNDSLIIIIYNIIYRDKIHKKLEQCFESKFERDKASKVHNIRDKYRRQFILIAAV